MDEEIEFDGHRSLSLLVVTTSILPGVENVHSQRYKTFTAHFTDHLLLKSWLFRNVPSFQSLRYRIPFVWMDRLEVSLGLRGHEDDECLLTLHGLSSTPALAALNKATQEAREAREAREALAREASPFSPETVTKPQDRPDGLGTASGSFQNPLSMTPQPLSSFESRQSPRSKSVNSPSMPLVFLGAILGMINGMAIESFDLTTSR